MVSHRRFSISQSRELSVALELSEVRRHSKQNGDSHYAAFRIKIYRARFFFCGGLHREVHFSAGRGCEICDRAGKLIIFRKVQ